MSDLMRLAGINSGYDSEAMIQQMMSAYQSKIDTQTKKLTKLQWKQEAYRDVTSKLKTFQQKYFDILNRSSYLLSPSTFSKFKSTVTANGVDKSNITITTDSNSQIGNHTLSVKQTAAAAKVQGKALNPENFSLDLSAAANSSAYTVDEEGNRNYNLSLDVKVGGVSKTLDLDVQIAQKEDGSIDMDAFYSQVTEKLNSELKDKFGYTGRTSDTGANGYVDGDGKELMVHAEQKDGKLNFTVGGNASVTVSENEGNFGLSLSSNYLVIDPRSAVTGENSVAVTVNGVSKNVKFEGISDTYYDSRNDADKGDLLTEFNDLKKAAYRRVMHLADNAEVTDEDMENFVYTSSDAAYDKNSKALSDALKDAFKDEGVDFSLNGVYLSATNDGSAVQFSMTSASGGTLGLGKGTASNKFDTANSTLKDLGIMGDGESTLKINGVEISVSGDYTVEDLVDAVNKSGAGVTMAYSKLENTFTITANDMGTAGNISVEESELAAALGISTAGGAVSTDGQNAIFELDGVEIVNDSNTYEVDGVKINFEKAVAGEEYDIGVSKDYTDVKQLIKDFVKDYNQLIDDVYGHIGTAPVRDSKNNLYEPLTDTDKEDMDEDEIEKWETAAKKGVIYNDETVSGIMSRIRSALYTSVTLEDGSKFGLYNMGITTMSYKDDAHGKLKIDEDQFDKVFDEHPEAVAELFTNTSGALNKVNDIIDSAISTTGTKGSLVRKAGIEGQTSAKDNELYRQMEQINKRISQLQDRYDAKEEYWWKVFTNLEKMMSDFNSQSAYISNMFSGYSGTM